LKFAHVGKKIRAHAAKDNPTGNKPGSMQDEAGIKAGARHGISRHGRGGSVPLKGGMLHSSALPRGICMMDLLSAISKTLKKQVANKERVAAGSGGSPPA
jgi:hypothetical protein